jgi:phenylacetate-CoA ligase
LEYFGNLMYLITQTMLTAPEMSKKSTPHSRLQALVPTWRQVPIYRDYPLHRLTTGEAAEIPAVFDDLPFTNKRQVLLGFPQNFLTDGETLERLQAQNLIELEHTSGTSQEQLPVIFRRGWWDAQEERALRLNSFVTQVLDANPQARRATLTPPACNGRSCFSGWRARTHRTIGNTLFVNQARIPFVLTETDLGNMVGEIREWAPQFLDVDPVHGAWFALHCERHGIRFPSVKFILCSYEFVSVVHRRILERAFGVPVFNLYGSTETGHLLMEDTRGTMKPCQENAFLEVVDAGVNGVGELVVTTLTNDLMPLLRYRIGDLAERREWPRETAYVVHGRRRDALSGGDGEKVTTWQVDQCFKEIPGLVSYQLQRSEDGLGRLRYVREDSGPSQQDLARLATRLENLLSLQDKIEVEETNLLPPLPSGKFRLTSPVHRLVA